MNRPQRNIMNIKQKNFVSGGIYDPRSQFMKKELAQTQKICLEELKSKQMSVFINPEPPVILPTPILNQIKQETPKTIPVIANQNVINENVINNNNNNNNEEGNADDLSEGDNKEKKGYFKKVFGIRKKPSIRAKEKKIRQNRRLRKVLLPKNALMALHEVKNIKIEDFVINNNLGGGFTATVTVNNVQYEGFGNSKNAAKNCACEKALRDLVILKMNQKPGIKREIFNENKIDETDNANPDEDTEMKELDDQDDDEIPMLNLASFALFKLFSEWETDGFEIPEFRPTSYGINSNGSNSDGGSSTSNVIIEKPKKQPTIRSELPPNWESMHPATLLCMMRPGIAYIDEGCEGIPPNVTQRFGITVDNEHFVGVGRSKKIARKNAAVNACNKLYGANFIQFET